MAIKLIKRVGEAKKRRKVSKKTKRSWRKHVDTNDVDKFLEDQRLEERLGAPFASRPDAELFAVDSAPDVEVPRAREYNSKAAYREALRKAEPKCYASLKSHTAVPDPIVKRNHVKTREKVVKINKKSTEVKRLNKPKRGQYNLDIWTVEEKILPDKIDSQWLNQDTIRHTLATKGMKQKIPKSVTFTKRSQIPAVDVPHPGTSYNPSYEDHQALLRSIADDELKLMKEEAHLNRVTTRMIKRVTVVERDENWLKESSEGLPLNPSMKKNQSDEDDDDDNEVKSVNPPVKNAKKTLVKRRKQREQRALALAQKHKKVEKRKIVDIYKLKFLKKNIEKREEKMKILKDKRIKVKAIKALEPKVLSKKKYEAPAVDFKLSEELTGNLRSAEPAGNMLRDRYKSLQQRNIVAPTTLVLKRNKPKVKKYIKADHKIVMPPAQKSK